MTKRSLRSYPDLKTWRDAQGFSQRDAARKFGISQSGWAKLENGQRHARAKLLRRLLDETGVPLEVLVGVNK